MSILLETKPYGKIEVEDDRIYNFKDGLFAFDELRKFALLDTDDNSPFRWLQSMEESELAFVIIKPTDFMISYELSISSTDLEAVGAQSVEELQVYAIVTIPKNTSDMTANLQGPIIMNSKTHLGKQAISMNDRYNVRHKILDEMAKASGGK